MRQGRNTNMPSPPFLSKMKKTHDAIMKPVEHQTPPHNIQLFRVFEKQPYPNFDPTDSIK